MRAQSFNQPSIHISTSDLIRLLPRSHRPSLKTSFAVSLRAAPLTARALRPGQNHFTLGIESYPATLVQPVAIGAVVASPRSELVSTLTSCCVQEPRQIRLGLWFERPERAIAAGINGRPGALRAA